MTMRRAIALGSAIVGIIPACGADQDGFSPPEVEWEPVAFQEIEMRCVDCVSNGGGFQTVTRTQADYDTVIANRYQRPLDAYWARVYDSTLETIRERNPGLSEEEYAERTRAAIYRAYPFQCTVGCTLPSFDFDQWTLLGFDTHGGGCSRPDYEVNVYRDEADERYIVRALVKEHGDCSMAIMKNTWLLVPRMENEFTVEFHRRNVKD